MIIDLLTGIMKLRNAWPKINSNFVGLKNDLANLSMTGSEHDALVVSALVDSEGVDFGADGEATYLDGRLNKWEDKFLRNAITPEMFFGSDIEKLQQAFDKALIDLQGVYLSKIYDIEDGTITITKGSDAREPLFVYGGGKIIKSIAGDMFDGVNASSSDILFNNIWFEGATGVNVTVFNCGDAKLIRIKTNQCYFSKIQYVFYSPTYLQDIKMNQDTVTLCTGALICARGIFVASINQLTMENCSGQVIVKNGTGGATDYAYNVVVENSIIEDFDSATLPLFSFTTGSFTLKNNYFEAIPAGVVKFTLQCEVCAIGNTLLGATNGIPFATLGTSTFGSSVIQNNISTLSPCVDATELTATAKVIVGGNASNFADIDPNSKVVDVFVNNINANIVKSSSSHYEVKISKLISSMTPVSLLTIDFNSMSGGLISVRGGGIQGNIGLFGVNKNFNILRADSSLSVSDGVIDEAWGSSSTQNDAITMVISGTNFILSAVSLNGYDTKYDLIVDIYGPVNVVTIN